MSGPVNSNSNLSNVGFKVTTTNLDILAFAVTSWGDKWKQRQVNLRFSNGRTFVDNDNTGYGIYGIEIVKGLEEDPLTDPSYYDMTQGMILQDNDGKNELGFD
jgi:hypothetical protein